MTLKVFIVDDEAVARARLRALLEDSAESRPNLVVGEADSGAAALEQLQNLDVDVVLTDIQMPGMDGMELARRLKAWPQPPAVIFVTAYDEHAITAFELQAADYLLKPVRLARLLDALARVPEQRDSRDYFSVNDRGRLWLVPVEEVLFLRAELKYVTLRTREREFVLDASLARLETAYVRDFVRIHRNCLVNRRYLVGFELSHTGEEGQWYAVLRDWPERLPVSRRQMHAIKDALGL